jgi:hypothetical protein
MSSYSRNLSRKIYEAFPIRILLAFCNGLRLCVLIHAEKDA